MEESGECHKDTRGQPSPSVGMSTHVYLHMLTPMTMHTPHTHAKQIHRIILNLCV